MLDGGCPWTYFVGGNVVKGGYQDAGGFAVNGGKGWASCVYKSHRSS